MQGILPIFHVLGARAKKLLLPVFFLSGILPGFATTYTVSNINDSGAGSLRQAITDANNNSGADLIVFETSGIIYLSSDLPALEGVVTITGTTDTYGAPVIALNGSGISNSTNALIQFNSGSGGSVLHAMVLQSGPNYGIKINSNGNTITGCFIGTNMAGSSAAGNISGGILVSATGNTIGGTTSGTRNIISGNGGDGVKMISGGNNNQIRGNYIGLASNGTSALGNGRYGIYIESATGNKIGSSTSSVVSGEENAIAYNSVGGIFLYNSGAEQNTIRTNSIFCNAQKGIDLNGTGNTNIAKPVITSSGANTVSGTSGANNVIHIYRSTTTGAGCTGEGETYLGTVTADGSGDWTFTHNLSLSTADQARISATQTDASGNTSEFGLAGECFISSVTTTTTCNAASNTYNVSGAISFTSAPSTGTLTITDNAGSGYNKSFDAPFTSPVTYEIANIPTSTAATHVLTVVFSGNTSCSFTQSYNRPSVSTPDAPVFTSGPTAICQGAANSTFTVSTGINTDHVQWSVDHDYAGTITRDTEDETTAVMQWAGYNYGTVVIKATAINGCASTTATRTVTVHPRPNISITSFSKELCEGATSVNFEAHGADTYSWSPSTGLSATTGATVTAEVSNTTYTVTGTSTDGCVGTTTVSPQQLNFTDNYSSDASWTFIKPVNFLAIENGKVTYKNDAPGNEYYRMYKTLPAPVSNESFLAEFKFTPTAVAGSMGPGHAIFSLTAGIDDPSYVNKGTGGSVSSVDKTNQDGIFVLYTSPAGGGASTYKLYFLSKDGNTFSEDAAAGYIDYTLALNTTYFVRLERLSLTNCQVSVYSDAAYTTLLASSCFSISAEVKNLNTLQHGGWLGAGEERALNATVDDVKVQNVCRSAEITGRDFLCANSGVYAYSVTEIPGATYSWTVTGMGTVTGSATSSVKVMSGNAADATVSVTVSTAQGCTIFQLSKDVTVGSIDQNAPISLTSPVQGGFTSLNTAVTYTVNRVPALSASTLSQHTLIFELAPEMILPDGSLVADWANKKTVSANYVPGVNPLQTGLKTQAINGLIDPDYVNERVYYWKAGIKYLPLDEYGHQPITWSETGRFILLPSEKTIPAEVLLTNNATHTNDINWVYSVSFLDDNKTVEGIAYIDGLGKGRQMQAKLNSVSKIMTMETVYSEESGGFVQSMAAPKESTTFGYDHTFFDVGDDSNARDFNTKDFDRLEKVDNRFVLKTPPAISEQHGVGNYYSDNNADAYVDKANGYPYAYNVAEQSPLGRPLYSAAGVGSTFKMSPTGKIIKSLYTHPQPTELIRVFGKDNAPAPEKISKTITYDPNQVGTVVYTDNEGKTIATALTACSSELEPLTEDGMTSFTNRLYPLKNDKADAVALEKGASSTFFISCNNVQTHILYNVDMNSFKFMGMPCTSCTYDVEVKIINTQTGEVVYTKTNVLSPSSTVCDNSSETIPVINEDVTLDGPAVFAVHRQIKPHFTNSAGLTFQEQVIKSYEEYLSSKTDSLRDQFKKRFLTEEKFYMLRKKFSGETKSVFVPPVCSNVTTWSGGGDQCNNGGSLLTAQYNHPSGITYNSRSGKFYISDEGNNSIRYVTKYGRVGLLAGDSCGAAGYVNDTTTQAKFDHPADVAVSGEWISSSIPPFSKYQDYVYVADKGNDVIRRIDYNGVVTTHAGINGEFSAPEGIFFDPVSRFIYVASTGNNKIFKVSLSGVVTHIAGTGTAGSTNGSTSVATFNAPTDIVVDKSGTIYVSERGNHTIRKISNDTVSTFAGTGSAGSFDAIGTSASFNSPRSLSIDGSSNLYVADEGNNRIRRVNISTGAVTTFAGTTSGYVNGEGSSAKFDHPMGLVMAPEGYLHVADQNNNRIRTMREQYCAGAQDSCVTLGNCKQYLWYVDEADTLRTDSLRLVNLDGQIDSVIAAEKYAITGLTYEGLASSTVEDYFKDAWYRMHWDSLTTERLVSMKVYSLNAGSNLGSTIAVLDDDKNLNYSDKQAYYLLKVKMVQPSCEENCHPRVFKKDCPNQCEEQHQAYKAEMDDAYKQMPAFLQAAANSSNPVLPSLTAYSQDKQDTYTFLFEKYKRNRFAYNNFDYQQCLDLCGGAPVSPCVTCQSNYNDCVFGNMTELAQGYDYFYNEKWTGSSFPYTYADLMQPGEGDPNQDVPNPTELERLSKPLFDLLVAHVNEAGGSFYKTKSNWEKLGGNCSNCQAAATSGCPAQDNRDMSQFPSILLPALEQSNAQCVSDYTQCLAMTGDYAAQTTYMANKNKEDCIAALGDSTDDRYTINTSPDYGKYDSLVTACSNMVCANPDSGAAVTAPQRRGMIEKIVFDLYPSSDDQDTVQALTTQLMYETKDMTLADAQKYIDNWAANYRCVKDCKDHLEVRYQEWVTALVDSAKRSFADFYINACFGKMNEEMEISYPEIIYHYTLYYYDYANNLVATVPPEGIDYINVGSTDAAERDRSPDHRMKSVYESSSLFDVSNQSPDGGKTEYLYDKAGRIRFSQNDEQKARGTAESKVIFSYTKYDSETGRITEVGEFKSPIGYTPSGYFNGLKKTCTTGCPSGNIYYAADKVDQLDWPYFGTSQQTLFSYDATDLPLSGYVPTYTEGRVTKISNTEGATHFGYDAHGRVKFSVQEINQLGTQKYKTVDYIYTDLTSQVKEVIYQKGQIQEEFHHKYTYDSDNRLTKIDVSRNGTEWLDGAAYGYYTHGSLKHVTLGNNIQDVDYTYNINGWLKAINNPLAGTHANATNEDDGSGSSSIAKDVFAEVLNYFNGDYTRTGTGINLAPTAAITPGTGSVMKSNTIDLFNGNISSTLTYTAFDKVTGGTSNTLLAQGYKYDYLNRLVDVYAETHERTGFAYNTSIANTDYKTSIKYDANGNIEYLSRNTKTMTVNSVSTNKMDRMSYKYASTTTDHYNKTKKLNNKLNHIFDAGIIADGLGDIVDQDSTSYNPADASTYNYDYDAKGRLIRDKQHEIEKIEWTAYDKVAKVTRTSTSTKPSLEFTYNANQQRLTKKVTDPVTPANSYTQVYVYDASGILMAIYKQTVNATTSAVETRLDELETYGLSRLGSYKVDELLTASVSSVDNEAGKLRFEISDHLGSVRAVVTGEKKTDGSNLVADIVSLSDYHEFGMKMNGRSWVSEKGRFGFQGMEKDDELSGEGDYNFGARIYDSRLGRMLTRDRFTRMAYPGLSPYNGMGNNPISNLDIDGNVIIFVNGYWVGKRKTPYQKLSSYWDAELKANAAATFDDYNAMYFNGTSSTGSGALTLLVKKTTLGIVGLFSSEKRRYNKGWAAAEKYARFIKEELDRERDEGNPNAKINFVSHSMGSAFKQGMKDYLKSVLDEDGNRLFKDDDFGEDVALAPFQPGKIEDKGPGNSSQYSHGNDFIAGSNKIRGVSKDQYNVQREGSIVNILDSHKNETFRNVFAATGQNVQPFDVGPGASSEPRPYNIPEAAERNGPGQGIPTDESYNKK